MKEKHLILFFLLLLVACNKSEEIKKFPDVVNKYDPSRPKEVVEFIPRTGRIDDNFIVEGNFGTDLSEMKVYFGERKAVLLKTNGQVIHGIVPKQLPGDNPITVVLGKDSILTDIKFKYRQVQSVTTIAGDYSKRQNWWEGGERLDGTLNECSFTDIRGLTVVAGGSILVSEGRDRMRLVSIEDNKVITLIGEWGPKLIQGAVTSTRELAYFIQEDDKRGIYVFMRSDGWVKHQVRIGIPELTGNVQSCTFAGDDRYLYIRDSDGNFGRVDTETPGYPFEMLMAKTWGSNGENKLCYCKYSDCFYVAASSVHKIYKIKQDKSTQKWDIELYAGQGNPGYSEGDRKKEALFSTPNGICADNYGNVYVTNRESCTIFKIWLKTGYVEHVAGVYNKWGTPVNGKPLESTAQGPTTIVMDDEENFFFAGTGDYQVRKYSIE